MEMENTIRFHRFKIAEWTQIMGEDSRRYDVGRVAYAARQVNTWTVLHRAAEEIFAEHDVYVSED